MHGTTILIERTKARLAVLREGYERAQQGSSHFSVNRIAERLALPPATVGGLCSVRGWAPATDDQIDLGMYLALEEELYDSRN